VVLFTIVIGPIKLRENGDYLEGGKGNAVGNLDWRGGRRTVFARGQALFVIEGDWRSQPAFFTSGRNQPAQMGGDAGVDRDMRRRSRGGSLRYASRCVEGRAAAAPGSRKRRRPLALRRPLREPPPRSPGRFCLGACLLTEEKHPLVRRARRGSATADPDRSIAAAGGCEK
jgi:hypothetical protein